MSFSMDTAEQASRAVQSTSAAAEFLKANGFQSQKTDQMGGTSLFLANVSDSLSEDALDLVVALTLSANETPSDHAALMSLAAHGAAAGKKVGVAWVEADPSGEIRHGRQLAEAFPILKTAQVLVVPSPVRPFELSEKMVVPLVRAFKGRSLLKLTSRIPSDMSDKLDAVGHLTRALQRIANQQLPTVITDETRQMFFGLRRIGHERLGLILAAMGPVMSGLAQENNLKDSPLLPFVAAATRNTAHPVELHVAPQTTFGSVPKEAWATLDGRVLPGTGGLKALMFQLRELLDDGCITLEEVAALSPTSATVGDGSLVAALTKSLSANGLSHVVVPWVADLPSDGCALCPKNGQVVGLSAVGDVAGDDLAKTAWFKSVDAFVEGFGL